MAAVLLGALLAPAYVLAQLPLLSGLGFNSALEILLLGLALLFPRSRRSLGGFVAVASMAVIAQYLFAWTPADGLWRIVLNVTGELPWPGRMAPLTAFSLLCCGVALVLLERPRSLRLQVLMQILPGLILVAVVGGLLNRGLNGLLLTSTLESHATMSVPTVAAMLVFVMGYVAALAGTPWFRVFYARREERQILALGLGGFAAALLLGGAAVIGLLGHQMQGLLENSISDAVNAKGASLRQSVSGAMLHVQMQGIESVAHGNLADLLRNLAGTDGVAWLEGKAASGRQLVGVEPRKARLLMRLRSAGDAWLAWNGVWWLEMRFPAPQQQGTIVAQIRLHELDRLFSGNEFQGTETFLCGQADDGRLRCFPDGLSPEVLLSPARFDGRMAPVLGENEERQGVRVAIDYRGALVVVARLQLRELGLELEHKVDAETLYHPLRVTLWRAILLVLGIGAVAVALIQARVRRVTRRAIESSRQLSGVLDILPVGVWVTDASGNFVLNNPAGKQIWAREDWTGAPKCCECKGSWHDTGERLKPDDWAIARAIKRGETSLDEIIDIECFDGSRKIISSSTLPLLDEKGAVTGVVAVDQDITERMQAEDELNASRNLLRSVVENAPVRVFWKDVELRYLGCNAAFAHDAGMRSPEELVGKDDFQMGWREQAERYRADDRRVMDSDMPIIGYEEQQITPDGRMIWLRTSKVPLHDANGKVIGVLGVYDDITVQKQMVEELRREKAKLDEAQRIGRMGSWELDLVRNSLDWSDEIFRIFEMEPARFDASYEAFLKAIHPDDRERVNQAYTDSLNMREPYEIEHRLLFPDGRIKHVTERCETFYDAGGKPLRSSGTVLDITERVCAEEEIRRLEREFHSLAENMPDIISRFDRELRRIYVNPEFERATGIPRDAALGKTHLEIGVSSEVAELWTNALRRVLFTEEPEVFEFHFSAQGGAIRHFQVRAVPEFGTSGEVEGVLTIARDISVMKGVETVLRESEARFHAITRNVPGMVFQCYRRSGEVRLRFTYVSEGAEGLLGLSPAIILRDQSELTGRMPETDRRSFSDSLSQSQESLVLWNWEGRVAAGDGSLRWINVRAIPRCHEDDMCIWDGVAINVSESKVHEEQLVQSQKMLRDLSAHLEIVREQERKHIAREIHDELGQTLTALRMDVSLARLGFGESNPKLMERLQSMTQLVDRTIRVARHVTSSLRPAALDLGVTAALEWLVEEFISYAGIPCELVLGDGDLVLSEASATTIFRVIQESLTNIARHAEATQAEIIVTMDEARLCFEVRDNGRGFDPLAAAGRRSFGLVGMRERVAMLQGEMQLESIPGQGTRVKVCVPVA
ncbi:MAG: PAS domain-containing protein [Sulfuricella denitrificans]|nr:PAS domain-containing protein [Sulfuricella denitrificans]